MKMKSKISLTLLCSILLWKSYVSSYSSGAPESTCDDMTPRHTGYPQSTTPPFTLTPNATSVTGGDRIQLRLEADGSGGTFKGFLLQARNSEKDTERLGTFFTANHNPKSCDGSLNNVVTHLDGTDKKTVTLEWEAPSDFEGDVFFRATVVREYVTYWTGLQSEKVSVKRREIPLGGVEPDRPPHDPGHDVTTTKGGVEKAITDLYFDCGFTKTCVGIPDGCVDKKNCDLFTSFTKVDDQHFEFEVLGSNPRGGRRYAAVGLSEDVKMGDDSVMVCSVDGSNVEVFNTWNSGRSNEPVINPKGGLTILQTGLFDGKHYCKFHRRSSTEFNSKKFDLNNQKYHVMLASGAITERVALQYHGNPNRVVTGGLVNLGLTNKLQSSLVKYKDLHAALMLIAWVGAASCGMLLARYFKQTWLGSKCCGIDQWFHWHRFFMVLTWSLNIAGLVLIVLELKDFRLINHAFIGISSIFLCFIQPLLAMCRCAPNGKNRWIFNWVHWFIGNSAQILGFAAIFLGMDIKFGETERNWIKEVMWYILIVFIAYHCLTHFILSILQCVSDRKAKQPSDVFPLKDLSDSRIPLQGEKIREDAPLGGLRKFFLGIYLPINWIATALLVICVVIPKGDIEDTLLEWGLPSFWRDLEAQQVR